MSGAVMAADGARRVACINGADHEWDTASAIVYRTGYLNDPTLWRRVECSTCGAVRRAPVASDSWEDGASGESSGGDA